MSQRGDTVEIVAVTHGTPLEGGGYLWHGEMRVWDNEALMGWYVANEGGRPLERHDVLHSAPARDQRCRSLGRR